jgi:ADP-heptose:LPS heptosyltransferase
MTSLATSVDGARLLDPSSIRRAVVIRALPGLGDCLCAVRALRRLRAGAPAAHVTMVGHPAGRWMPDRFPELIDEWTELPHWPSIIECTHQRADTARWLRSVRGGRRYDLALQLHGSGGPINWLGVALGADTVAVHSTPDRLGPWGVTRIWPDTGHESERLADLVGVLGFPAADPELDFPLRPADRAEAAERLDDAGVAADAAVIVVHPGASRADRRWPMEGFAAVAGAAVARGAVALVSSGPGEAALADTVVGLVGSSRCRRLAASSIGGLAAVLERARAVVVNDTGVAHLSVAVRTPTVVVGTTSDLDRWGPRDRERHRVVATRGPHALDDVDVVRVVAAVDELVANGRGVGCRRT